MLKKALKFAGIGLILFLGVYLHSGCASRGEIKRFSAQLDSLSVVNTMQSRQISRLDSTITANADLLRELKAEQNANLRILQEEIRVVQSGMRDSGFKVSDLEERIESISVDYGNDSSEDSTDSDDSTSLGQDLEFKGSELYATALVDLNQGKYQLAIMGFEAYLEDFPEGPKADDSRYYIAEAKLAEGNYLEAAISYLTITKKWPDSRYVPSALYKAGWCYQQADQMEMASRYYNRVIDEYPQNSEAKLAEKKLEEIEGD